MLPVEMKLYIYCLRSILFFRAPNPNSPLIYGVIFPSLIRYGDGAGADAICSRYKGQVDAGYPGAPSRSAYGTI